MQENDANMKLVAEKLRSSIGALCGKLKDNPNVAENAAKVATERQMLQVLLGKALDELTTAKKVPCIMETVLSEQYKRKEIRDVVDREKTASRAVINLRMDLHDEKEQHDKECCGLVHTQQHSLCSHHVLELDALCAGDASH
jgi:hypothetical protein